jgi:uncharacterized protein
MDEILASIKKIIADEDRVRPSVPKKTARTAKADAIADLVVEETDILELVDTAADQDAGHDELLADDKAEKLRHSFSALQMLSEPGVAPQIVRSGETSLEGLTRELLKPVLKQWLDDNLPVIVEAMVEREIARITKKG